MATADRKRTIGPKAALDDVNLLISGADFVAPGGSSDEGRRQAGDEESTNFSFMTLFRQGHGNLLFLQDNIITVIGFRRPVVY